MKGLKQGEDLPLGPDSGLADLGPSTQAYVALHGFNSVPAHAVDLGGGSWALLGEDVDSQEALDAQLAVELSAAQQGCTVADLIGPSKVVALYRDKLEAERHIGGTSSPAPVRRDGKRHDSAY